MFPKSLPKKFKRGLYTSKTIRTCACKMSTMGGLEMEMKDAELGDWRDFSKRKYKKLQEERLKTITPHVIGDVRRGPNHFFPCDDRHSGFNYDPRDDKKRLRAHRKSQFKAVGIMDVDDAIDYFLSCKENLRGIKI